MLSKAKFNVYSSLFWFILALTISLAAFYVLECLVPLEWPVVKLFTFLGFVDTAGQATFLNRVLLIDYQCSGFFSIFVYLALIFSPITVLPLKKKFKVFFIGFVILYLANILRLLLLFWLSSYLGIEFLHVFGWMFMSVIILLLWYFANFKNRF